MIEASNPPVSEPASEPAPARAASLGRLIAYALPGAPASAIDTPISVYLPALYASAGLSLGLVGALLLVGRLAEIPIALGLGALSDRVGPERARRRFWLLVAAPLALLGLWRLFVPPAAPGPAYLMSWLLVVVAAGTLLQINHIAWGAEIAQGYVQRTRAQAARQIASVAGLVLVLLPPIAIERLHAADTDRLRMLAIAGFFLLMLPLTVGGAVLLAPERPTPRPAAAPPGAWREALATLGSNRALRRLLLIDLADAGALGVVTGLFVFLSREVWGLGSISSLLVLTYVLSGVVCLGPILKAARGRSKSKTVTVIALILAAALPLMLLVPTGAAGWAFACIVVLGAPSAVNAALMDSMMGDIAAADAAARGEARTGVFYALHMIMGRVGRGVAVAIGFALLDRVGFHAHAANSEAALNGFRAFYVGVPLLLQLAIAAMMWRFPEPAHPRD
jgi:GPH family glycoside/pentoside/hexuronide:cation symporter